MNYNESSQELSCFKISNNQIWQDQETLFSHGEENISDSLLMASKYHKQKRNWDVLNNFAPFYSLKHNTILEFWITTALKTIMIHNKNFRVPVLFNPAAKRFCGSQRKQYKIHNCLARGLKAWKHLPRFFAYTSCENFKSCFASS